MAKPNPKGPAQHWIVRFLPVETLKEAQNLALRFQEGKAFRLYVLGRMRLVVPVVLLILVFGVACASAIVVFLAGLSSLLVLPAILLMPFVLVGSLFVLAYVFFAWLENRALAQTLKRGAKPPQGAVAAWLSRKFGVDMGTYPPVPWILAAIFLFVPLAMLATFALGIALILIVLAILAPIVYARFDR
ncbi:MAG TPA: hypothetical protein VFB20_14825 [Burkholderiales bacterium]|nr:hypothetical protein [Burkholderiales bacterium]